MAPPRQSGLPFSEKCRKPLVSNLRVSIIVFLRISWLKQFLFYVLILSRKRYQTNAPPVLPQPVNRVRLVGSDRDWKGPEKGLAEIVFVINIPVSISALVLTNAPSPYSSDETKFAGLSNFNKYPRLDVSKINK